MNQQVIISSLSPENMNVYTNIKFASTSIYDYPLNNYDINYIGEVLLTYTISYHNVDDTSGYKMSHLKTDDTYVLPIPERKGYTFIHWLDNDNQLAIQLEKGNSGNKDYTVVWNEIVEPLNPLQDTDKKPISTTKV